MVDGRQGGQFVKCRHHNINGGVTFPMSGNYEFPITWSLWQCNVQERPCRFAIFRDRKPGVSNSGCHVLVFLLEGPNATVRTFVDLGLAEHVFAEQAIEK